MLRSLAGFIIMVVAVLIYTPFVLWVGYAWGIRERYARSEGTPSRSRGHRPAPPYAPRHVKLALACPDCDAEPFEGDPDDRRSHERHCPLGPRAQGDWPARPGGSQAPAAASPPPAKLVAMVLLERVRDGLRRLRDDPEPASEEPFQSDTVNPGPGSPAPGPGAAGQRVSRHSDAALTQEDPFPGGHHHCPACSGCFPDEEVLASHLCPVRGDDERETVIMARDDGR